MAENDDRPSYSEYARLAQEVREEREKREKVEKWLRTCDWKKQKLATICRYNEESNCTIDDNRPCRTQCLKGEIKKIGNDAEGLPVMGIV